MHLQQGFWLWRLDHYITLTFSFVSTKLFCCDSQVFDIKQSSFCMCVIFFLLWFFQPSHVVILATLPSE